MESAEGGDGWARPSGAPSTPPSPPVRAPGGPPPDMPRFEAAPSFGVPPAPAPSPWSEPSRYEADPPLPAALPGYAPAPGSALPPPPDPGWDADPYGMYAATAVAPQRGWCMTRGWAWTALVLLVSIPIAFVVSIVYLFVASPGSDESDPQSMEGEWFPLAVFFMFFLWLVASAAGALLSAIIGTVRARRHPEVASAPVITVFVWLGLFLLAAPVVISLVGGGIETLFG